eukprot:TRINITY_DN11637_c0_g1_i8.p1 TRINITY_DN11637_c0_g1~~TRINITY_DN11637_c0_g1_i8.p1  ORF type:complete len:588 (-),score=108.15 TRINITY_DN11637_c0_g1_i8:182-1945(-)
MRGRRDEEEESYRQRREALQHEDVQQSEFLQLDDEPQLRLHEEKERHTSEQVRIGKLRQRRHKEHAAAVRIQRVVRGVVDRRRAHKRSQDMEYRRRELARLERARQECRVKELAAVRIQSVIRGTLERWGTRRRLEDSERLRRELLRLEAIRRRRDEEGCARQRMEAVQKEDVQQSELLQLDDELQLRRHEERECHSSELLRIGKLRQRRHEEEAAAVRIQRVVRGVVDRRRAHKRSQDMEYRRRELARLERARQERRVKEVAAVRIQSVIRGTLERWRTRRRLEDSERLRREFLRLEAIRRRRDEEQESYRQRKEALQKEDVNQSEFLQLDSEPELRLHEEKERHSSELLRIGKLRQRRHEQHTSVENDQEVHPHDDQDCQSSKGSLIGKLRRRCTTEESAAVMIQGVIRGIAERKRVSLLLLESEIRRQELAQLDTINMPRLDKEVNAQRTSEGSTRMQQLQWPRYRLGESDEPSKRESICERSDDSSVDTASTVRQEIRTRRLCVEDRIRELAKEAAALSSQVAARRQSVIASTAATPNRTSVLDSSVNVQELMRKIVQAQRCERRRSSTLLERCVNTSGIALS